MRTILTRIALGALISLGAAFQARAQISLTASAGTASATFTTLKAAFDAVNAGTHQGAIQISVTANTVETASAVLKASGSGRASYSSVAIRPSGGAYSITTGTAFPAGVPLIDLDGADSVTIDGLNSGGNSLTIENTTVANLGGTSTIRLINGATANTVVNCYLKGASTSDPLTIQGGVILFSTDGSTGNGNDYNLITRNDIGPSGSNLPTVGVHNAGSTSNVALANSDNTISYNKIHDCFRPNNQSAGISIRTGAFNWAVTGNRIYMSQPRTFTGAAFHAGILTTQGFSIGNFLINDNIVGYSDSLQNGVYEINNPAVAGYVTFRGISGSGTNLQIRDNTIAGIRFTSGSTSGAYRDGAFTGIYLENTGTARVVRNTVGSVNDTGSIVVTMTAANLSVDAAGIFANFAGGGSIDSNRIGGIRVSGQASGSLTFSGIATFQVPGRKDTIRGNFIGGPAANSILMTGSGSIAAILRGIFTQTGSAYIDGNTVRNLCSGAGSGGTATQDASVLGIHTDNELVSGSSGPKTTTISNNTVYNLSNTDSTAASPKVFGIHLRSLGNTGLNSVSGNNVWNLTTYTPASMGFGYGTVSGIQLSALSRFTVFNNTVSLGSGIAPGSKTRVYGIMDGGSSGLIYHNSVYIGGIAAAGALNSWAFCTIGTSNPEHDVRSNIFMNARSNSGASGKHYAVGIITSYNYLIKPYGSNILYAPGSGGRIGSFANTDALNLGEWNRIAGLDYTSFSADPRFVDPEGAVPDLHINTALASPVEGGGDVTGVAYDMDGQARSGLTPADIGADAGNFTAGDFSDPRIVFTPLINKCSAPPYSLSADITDASGIPTSGPGLPVLYWKINSGGYSAATASHAGGSSYNFSFGSGAAPGDTISYYIVAQDAGAVPRLGSSPAVSTLTANPPAGMPGATPPASFYYGSTLSGSYNVGTGGAFTTLTQAVTAYNKGCLSGPVEFALTNTSYNPLTEQFPVTVSENGHASSVNTLTIKPAVSAVTITGSASRGLIRLEAARHVTLDGSYNGTASRNLLLNNTSTASTASAVWVLTNAQSGATDNVIRNLSVTGPTSGLTADGIVFSGSGSTQMLTERGRQHKRNAVENCVVKQVSYGIAVRSNPGTADSFCTIRRNVLGGAGADALTVAGIEVTGVSGLHIEENSVLGVIRNSTTVPISGIGLRRAVSKARILRNNISDVLIAAPSSSSSGGAFGIHSNADDSVADILIANNFISNIACNAQNTRVAAAGLHIEGVGTGVRLLHNSIRINLLPAYTGGLFACLLVGEFVPPRALTVLQNIFSSEAAGGYRYAVVHHPDGSAFDSIDRNSYSGNAVGNDNGTICTTLSNWRTIMGGDANSTTQAPAFVSNTDLHLSSPTGLAIGHFLPDVPRDYDNEPRLTTGTIIGADDACSAGSASAGMASLPVSNTSVTLPQTGTTYYAACPEGLIAGVQSSGTSPASGTLTAKVYVAANAISQSGQPFVRRYYDISPAVNPNTATATLTLYFTQSDFDDYNSRNGTFPDLPVSAADLAGISRLRIFQQHGTSTSGAPGSYTGWSGSGPANVSIVPSSVSFDATALRWEVTFPVRGFSGFFVYTGIATPLSVNGLELTARAAGGFNELSWESLDMHPASYRIERSADGRNFSLLGTIAGTNARVYDFRDGRPLPARSYYRLQAIEENGQTSYSNVAIVQRAFTRAQVTVSPVPAIDRVTVTSSDAELDGSEAVIRDIRGAEIHRFRMGAANTIDISPWSPGVYILYLENGDAIRLMKR